MEFVSTRNALIKRNVDGLKESLSQRTGQDLFFFFFEVAEIIVIKKVGQEPLDQKESRLAKIVFMNKNNRLAYKTWINNNNNKKGKEGALAKNLLIKKIGQEHLDQKECRLANSPYEQQQQTGIQNWINWIDRPVRYRL